MAADAGDDSRDFGWEASRVISDERERENVLVNHKTILVKNYYIFKSFVLIKQCENKIQQISYDY